MDILQTIVNVVDCTEFYFYYFSKVGLSHNEPTFLALAFSNHGQRNRHVMKYIVGKCVVFIFHFVQDTTQFDYQRRITYLSLSSYVLVKKSTNGI